MDEQYPALSTFVGAYLNQDHDMIGETLQAILAVFVEENPANQVVAIRRDARRFLEEQAADLEAEFARRYGYQFVPESWGHTAKSFLEWLIASAHH